VLKLETSHKDSCFVSNLTSPSMMIMLTVTASHLMTHQIRNDSLASNEIRRK